MKKAIRVIAVALALAAVSPPAMAQQADPSKQSLSATIKQKYLERRARFVRRVKDIYFAVGCKVLPGEDSTRARARKDSLLASVREQAVLDLKEDEDLVRDAMQEGLNRASKPGACDYYRRHPEAAEAIRRTAAEAAAGQK
jgi:alkanesulfonate monooxygenase SsuD/methylene tetrahydromethanopterin reductase-like flavin-dependent oxidoreductase (luciferase family)